ncbi:hypothetical protein ID866_5384 [Astraeus odoratus]|nr:hypothetical protein ID866_5384 [Astraeus odoratus]
MNTVPKLTKRAKKAIAFRDRKQGKSSRKSHVELGEENDVPILEDQVLAEGGCGDTQGEEGSEPGRAIRNSGREGKSGKQEELVGSKRKRQTREEAQGVNGQPDRPKGKRRKGLDGDPVVDAEEEQGKKPDNSKQRFILFLGNLKYTTTVEVIQGHFSTCDPPPTVRLLTPKPSTKSSTKLVTKSKGCAFLEFRNRNALQQGLKLHHSQLDGRTINVELTAGGGGKGEARLKKLKERNKELEGQRRKKQEKRLLNPVPSSKQVEGAQRFSATSGVEQVHVKKRTWSVDDVAGAEKSRGGKRHAKRTRVHKQKSLGTGVNAIPVG